MSKKNKEEFECLVKFPLYLNWTSALRLSRHLYGSSEYLLSTFTRAASLKDWKLAFIRGFEYDP